MVYSYVINNYGPANILLMFLVYKRFYMTLPPIRQVSGGCTVKDTIRATPAQPARPLHPAVPAVFDTVLVQDHAGERDFSDHSVDGTSFLMLPGYIMF